MRHIAPGTGSLSDQVNSVVVMLRMRKLEAKWRILAAEGPVVPAGAERAISGRTPRRQPPGSPLRPGTT
jgi:hypothetical protein